MKAKTSNKMKKTFLLVFAILFLFAGITYASTEYKYEYYEEENSEFALYGAIWGGQHFTVGNVGTNENFTITQIGLKLDKTGSPGTLNVDVYAVDGTDGDPTGVSLSSGTLAEGDIPASENWVNISMSQYTFREDTQYIFVFKATSGDISNKVGVSVNTSGGYTGGYLKLSADSGSSWLDGLSAYDVAFQIYGNQIPTYPFYPGELARFTVDENNDTYFLSFPESFYESNWYVDDATVNITGNANFTKVDFGGENIAQAFYNDSHWYVDTGIACNNPQGITNAGSDFYVLDPEDDRVYKYNSAGVYQSNFEVYSQGSLGAYAITSNETHLFVIDKDDNEVDIYAVSGGAYLSSWSYSNLPLVYGSDFCNDQIWMINTSGTVCNYTVTGTEGDCYNLEEVGSASSLACDGETFWVGDNDANLIKVYNYTTKEYMISYDFPYDGNPSAGALKAGNGKIYYVDSGTTDEFWSLVGTATLIDETDFSTELETTLNACSGDPCEIYFNITSLYWGAITLKDLLLNFTIAPTDPTTLTPANESIYFDGGSAALTCSGSTHPEGGDVYYEFWNETALMQNTTSTTYTWGSLEGGNNLEWYCRACDEDNYCSSNVSRNFNVMDFYNCTSGNITLNLTFKDEADVTDLNATLPTVSLDFASEDDYTYYFSEANINRSEFMFCLNPEDISIAAEGNIKYKSGDDYPLRTFYYDGNLIGNTTDNQILYLLHTDDGTYVTFQAQTISQDPISGVLIKVERNLIAPDYDATYEAITQQTTDGSGTTTFWLNPDYEHKFTFTKSGYQQQVQYITPSETSYTVVMELSAEDVQYIGDTKGMLWTVGPQVGRLNEEEYTFEFNITAQNDNLLGCKFEIRQADGTVVATDEGCLTSDVYGGDNLSATYTVQNGDELWGIYYIKVNATCPTTGTSTGYCQGGANDGDTCNTDADCLAYGIIESDVYWYEMTLNTTSWNSLNSIWEDLADLSDFGAGKEQEFSRIIWFFLFATVFIAMINFFTGWENQNPGGAIFAIIPVIFLASAGGFFEISMFQHLAIQSPMLATFLNTWTVFLISLLFLAGWLMNKVRRESSL